MRLLDRYLLRFFLFPFLYCEVGFFSIWLIYDLSTNINAFLEIHIPLKVLCYFYIGQAPAILILTLPIGLLLSLLYCLTRLSQSNEIIAMLNAGRSLERILMPFFAVGVLMTGLSGWLNNNLAPKAEAKQEEALANIETGNTKFQKQDSIKGYLFANRIDNRLWHIEKLPLDDVHPLQGVQIIQQNADGQITNKYYASTATYDAQRHLWKFSGSTKVVHYNTAGDVDSISFPAEQEFAHWSETPWRIGSAVLKPDHLSVQELKQYLTLNADFNAAQLAPYKTYWHYRHALPWLCLVVVFMSAPLGVIYTRRSVVVGVASAIFLFFAILFLDNLSRALGRGDRIAPWLAAWGPNILFTGIGLFLLRMRSLNRDQVPSSLKDWLGLFIP